MLFEVTQDHLKLLKRLQFGYDEYTEFGAPEVDPKRPYGNSDVYEDIAEILGIEPVSDDYWDEEFTDEQKAYMLKVHKEMEHVLQILVRHNSLGTGTYTRRNYQWHRATV